MAGHNNDSASEGASDPRQQPSRLQEIESKDQAIPPNKDSDHSHHLPSKTLPPGSADEPLIPFILHWTCIVLTVAASVVFGIWAPLSYRAAANGNRDNNAAQNSAISAMSAANELALSANAMGSTVAELASRADALQRSQLYLLEGLDYRASAMGMLDYLSFCRGQNVCVPSLARSISVIQILHGPSFLSTWKIAESLLST